MGLRGSFPCSTGRRTKSDAHGPSPRSTDSMKRFDISGLPRIFWKSMIGQKIGPFASWISGISFPFAARFHRRLKTSQFDGAEITCMPFSSTKRV